MVRGGCKRWLQEVVVLCCGRGGGRGVWLGVVAWVGGRGGWQEVMVGGGREGWWWGVVARCVCVVTGVCVCWLGRGEG